jgi:nicotinamide-nucleotide amidase
MAEGVRRVTGADLGLATTGVAGPDGGTDAKPVGTLWLALADAQGTICHPYQLMAERWRNKQMTSELALDRVRRRLLGLAISERTFPRLRGDAGARG